jgi:hypothetical protein
MLENDSKHNFILIMYEKKGHDFEFLNIHISHLTQLGIITIILKCQNKNILV